MDELFTEFNEQPIASGSIGQVYKATMKDGKEVAVKVMHPNMEIKRDDPNRRKNFRNNQIILWFNISQIF